MAKSLLVIGGSGQLGQSIQKIGHRFPDLEIHYTTREQLDLSSSISISDYFRERRFDLVINCAAYTAVDQAESVPELAEQINHFAVEQLARMVKQQQGQLIHVSTDYVFDGHAYRPYRPEGPVNPQSVYGSSKRRGEQAMQAVAPRGVIVRTSWLYSEFGSNFVKTMLRLGSERDALQVVADQVGSPTYATDLAEALLVLAGRDENETGQEKSCPIYHYANHGVASWYDLAQATFELAGITCKVTPISTEQYPTAAVRPHYSVLDSSAIQQDSGIEIPYWRESLGQCLKQFVQ